MKIWKRIKAWLGITGEIAGPPKYKKPAPCGDDETHYYWTDSANYPCPRCLAQREKRIQKQKDEIHAQRIAELVVQKMKDKKELKRVKQ